MDLVELRPLLSEELLSEIRYLQNILEKTVGLTFPDKEYTFAFNKYGWDKKLGITLFIDVPYSYEELLERGEHLQVSSSAEIFTELQFKKETSSCYFRLYAKLSAPIPDEDMALLGQLGKLSYKITC